MITFEILVIKKALYTKSYKGLHEGLTKDMNYVSLKKNKIAEKLPDNKYLTRINNTDSIKIK